MPNEMLPMSTWTPKDGQTYEIVDKDARDRITAIEQGGGGGSGGGETLLGNTPVKLTNPATVILRGSGQTEYSVKSDTVAIFDPMNGTPSNASIALESGEYVLTAGTGASAWYQAYVDATVTGLTVGETYNFVFDAAGVTTDDATHQTVGHYILYDASGNTLVTRAATDGAHKNVYAFTAPTSSVRLRWYPATNNTFSAGVSVARVKRLYINAANTSEYSTIVDLSGSFTGETRLRSLPAGVTVNATPACAVYSVAEESETAKPLYGKTVVVFGDSLIGMVRDDTSATAVIAERTGATVYNVGFGGCRMSDHPSHGYAEFSMWALAKAIADNDWTDQDTYASQGSDYFPEQLATLKDIDFSEVDYAVIHYGTNDFGGGVAIGADSAATVHNTLCGALRYSLSTLLGAYPNLRIFVSLPCFRFWTVDGQTVYSDTYQNSQGNTLTECVSALAAVAREYKVPVIDNYYLNGINSENASDFLSDGTHHNTAGRFRFGECLAEKLSAGGDESTYSKPATGIPASDLASGVIPSVPQMATDPNMADWATGKMVDAGVLATNFNYALIALQTKADKANVYTKDEVYTKTEVDQKLVGAMDYKGTKATVSALPTSGNKTGDVWHITADGSEWAWNGSAWEELGTAVDLSGYATEQWVENKGYLTQHQDISGKADKIPRVVKTAQDETATIEPNKLYVFPEIASLTITLATPTDNTIVNEYHFIFESGDTATTLTIPASINQPDGFTVEANMHYEVSILEGAMTAQGWAVSA